MHPLKIDPETGFLESDRSSAFDGQSKVKLLDMARKIREVGGWPSITSLCKAIGINDRTFYTHLSVDQKFKEAWLELVHDAADALESKMYEYAQNKGGYMHMITWLRANQPEKWNPESKLILNADSSGLKSVIDSASTVIDATIVENTKQLPVNCPSDKPK